MSNNLRCLKHKDYFGATGPTLSCSTCCSIYINRINHDKTIIQKEPEVKIEQTKSLDKYGRPLAAQNLAKQSNKNVLMSNKIKH